MSVDSTINMRVAAHRKERLERAADLAHQSLSAFVLAAADERANELLARETTTVLDADFFDAFFDGLAPEPVEALRNAASRLSHVVHDLT